MRVADRLGLAPALAPLAPPPPGAVDTRARRTCAGAQRALRWRHELLALYFIVVALVWIDTKVDGLSKNVAALTETMRNSKAS